MSFLTIIRLQLELVFKYKDPKLETVTATGNFIMLETIGTCHNARFADFEPIQIRK